MSDDIQTRKTTEAQLIDRAMKDAAFRAELIADPKAVFQRELGVDVPASVDVQVMEELPTKVYLVLPPATPGADAELSDAELESVAGGWTDQSCGAITGGCGTCLGEHTCDRSCI